MDTETKRKERPKLLKRRPVTSDKDVKPQNMKASNVFFLALFWAIGLVCTVKNVWILELLTVPFVIYLIKKMIVWIGTDNVLYGHLESTKLKLKLWAQERKHVLAPAPVPGIMRTVLLGDKKVFSCVNAYWWVSLGVCHSEWSGGDPIYG
jgi:hypothetical protein